MQDNLLKLTPKKLSEGIQATVHWFFPIVGLIYSSGFLIVFRFLRSYGISDIDFVQAKYIHIGSLYVMACVVLLLPLSWLVFHFIHLPLIDPQTTIGLSQSNNATRRYLTISFIQEMWIGLRKFFKQFEPKPPPSPIYIPLHFRPRSTPKPHLTNTIQIKPKDSSKHPHTTLPNILGSSLMLFTFYIIIAFANRDFPREYPLAIILSFTLPFLLLLSGIVADGVVRHDFKADILIIQCVLFFLQCIVFIYVVYELDSFWEMLVNENGLATVFPCCMIMISFYGIRMASRLKQVSDSGQRWHMAISNGFIIGFFFYLSIQSFSHSIYTYIPSIKGGGDYTEADPIHITLKSTGGYLGLINFSQFNKSTTFASVDDNFIDANDTNNLIVIVETDNALFVADRRSALGPKEWRAGIKKPVVYQIPFSEIKAVSYVNNSN